jgi:hypothetical protein
MQSVTGLLFREREPGSDEWHSTTEQDCIGDSLSARVTAVSLNRRDEMARGALTNARQVVF